MHSPVLIIGSGLAGLSAAYQLSKHGISCTVVTKDETLVHGSNSELAQGGIIYRPEDDTPAALVSDILSAGDQINFEPAVSKLATDGITLVKQILIEAAKVPFDLEIGGLSKKSSFLDNARHQAAASLRFARSPSPKQPARSLRRARKKYFSDNSDRLSFTQEAAHDRARIIHVKDHTGKAIMEHLSETVKKSQHVKFLTGHILVDLLTSGHNCKGYEMKYQRNRCLGAYLFDVKTGEVKTMLAEHTILATGGVGQVYEYHTNAEHSYGSGLAAANRARVRIINSRFVQFHPTALWTKHSGRRFLISEALRGEGAKLQNAKGEYFMDPFPQKDLESRAVVSRAIMEELRRTGDAYVFLNLADHYQGSLPIPQRFPSIFEACQKEGIDISREPIPVVPAAHFFCGGIAVDLHGQSELPGLFAAGEVACTGVHGSNRLASTSLLEALTWGVAAADQISALFGSFGASDSDRLGRAFRLVEDWQSFGSEKADPKKIEEEKNHIRQIMWEKVGIIRTREGLLQAKEALRTLWNSVEKKYSASALSEDLIELRHMAETAWIITNSASSHTNLRKDSLGGHVLVSL